MGEFGAIRNCPPPRRPLETSVAGADEARTRNLLVLERAPLETAEPQGFCPLELLPGLPPICSRRVGVVPQGLELEERLRTEGKDPLSGVLEIPLEVGLIPRS